MARVEEEVDTVEVSGMAAAWCTAFAGPTRCQRHKQTATLICTADLPDAAMRTPTDQPAKAVLAVGELVRQTAARRCDGTVHPDAHASRGGCDAWLRHTCFRHVVGSRLRSGSGSSCAACEQQQQHIEAAQPVLQPCFNCVLPQLVQLSARAAGTVTYGSWALQRSHMS
jgi:hypothetical protein